MSKLSHTLRSFIFSFTSHTLYNNAMISHFVQNYDPTWKHCENGGLRPAPKETLLQIFLGLSSYTIDTERLKHDNYWWATS